MAGILDNSGSSSQHGRKVVPSSADDDATESLTTSYLSTPREPLSSSEVVDEHDQTIISQRPVAAPEEFYKSLPLAELAEMLEGRQLDHFSVEQMIGGGGMGAVFRGKDERLDRTVAIKVIPAAKREPETLRRFRLEAQAAARLDHPNIARVYYVGEAEQWNYIVFEFIDGVNIRDLVDIEGPLSVDDAVYYTRQIAEALQHAHQRDVVHRDIKPSNILVTAGGIAKVVDMGLARNNSVEQSRGDATASGVTLGTFDYISPEQARDPRDADVRSDLYSLGCSLFFMLTGHPPFPEGTALQKLLNHGSLPPPDPRGWRDDLSDQLYAVLMKLMAKQPGARYQKPTELINDLMLLAEVEDLPRSQSPGTMLLTPSIVQRTLLESNLPWLVAFAFLLGSTLWLHSVQAISGDRILPAFRPDSAPAIKQIPALKDSRSSNAAELPNKIATPSNGSIGESLEAELPTQPSGPIPSEIDSAAKNRTDPIVVSVQRPLDVDVDRWESSLDSAIQRCQRTPVAGGIEIRGRVTLDQPVTLMNTQLLIRGIGPAQCAIEISQRLLEELRDWEGAINLNDSAIELVGVELLAAVANIPDNRRIGLLTIGNNSKCSLSDCQVTIGGSHLSSNAFYAVLADESSTTVASDVESEMLIELEQSFIRGNGSFLGLRVSSARAVRHIEVTVRNSLLALSGVGIEVVHANDIVSRVARNLRVFCEQSTFATSGGFAVVDYTGPSQPLLSLNRTSSKCVYYSRQGVPHVTLRGINRESFYGTLEWLLFKGNDNAYDTIVDTLCICYDPDDQQIFSFGFDEASREGWFEERGNDRQVRWLNHNVRSGDYSKVAREEFRIIEGMYSPGFQGQDTAPPL